MVIEIILGVSAVLNIGLLIGVRNLLRQNEQLEDDFVTTINGVVTTITQANEKMKQADPICYAIIRGLALRINDANDLAEKYWKELSLYKSLDQ